MNWVKLDELHYNRIINVLNKRESGNRKAKIFFIVFLFLCSIAFIWYHVYILSILFTIICIALFAGLSKKHNIRDIYICNVRIISVDHRVDGNSESYFTVQGVDSLCQIRVLGSRSLGRKFDTLSDIKRHNFKAILIRYIKDSKQEEYYLLDSVNVM